ncbi:hypothetical protein TSUD_300970 [Trifolium subterraneum]|uniref:Uncharacterized protein n=1 Tax=Trifolium subterraneum TaxID=3900 RepID=A0A2Z6P214_TRISU|nr:hypothetical protein TSUD_300970 [Trifolium subterraneum]
MDNFDIPNFNHHRERHLTLSNNWLMEDFVALKTWLFRSVHIIEMQHNQTSEPGQLRTCHSMTGPTPMRGKNEARKKQVMSGFQPTTISHIKLKILKNNVMYPPI